MSNLLEFGGKANVILRAICDFEVNGNVYKTDDVVFCFEEVDVQFTYNETVKDKYDIRNVTKDRAEWYKTIIKKK